MNGLRRWLAESEIAGAAILAWEIAAILLAVVGLFQFGLFAFVAGAALAMIGSHIHEWRRQVGNTDG